MVFFQYLVWHFFDVPRAIFFAWRNFLLFTLNYFSVPLLLRTFFSHWRRYSSSYGRGFSPKRYLEVLVFNIMSRVIGMVLRAVFIALGVAAEVLVILLGAIVLLSWLFLPVILIIGFVFGIRLIFYA